MFVDPSRSGCLKIEPIIAFLLVFRLELRTSGEEEE